MKKTSITVKELMESALAIVRKRKDMIWKCAVLAVALVSFAMTFSLFNTPFLYSETSTYTVIPADVFNYDSSSYVSLLIFIPLAILFVISLFKLVAMLRKMASSKKSFADKTQKLIYMNVITTGIYFLAGMCVCTFYNAKGRSYAADESLKLLILQIGVTILFALLVGGINEEGSIKKRKTAAFARFEMFAYTSVAAVVSLICLFGDILQVTFIKPSYYEALKLNGFKMLTTYQDLGKGFQLISFIVMVLVVVVITLSLLVLVSYISKSKMFFKFALASLTTSGLTTLLVGLLGKYYEIVTLMNTNTMFSWISQNINIPVDIEMQYKVKSSAIIWFFIALAMILFTLLRKPYTRGTMGEAEISVQAVATENVPSALTSSENAKPAAPLVSASAHDPCPAFSELDAKAQGFRDETRSLAKNAFDTPSLPGLVQFIVSYARNSRLHLSYTAPDIAAFIAGLGSTKLTILQGMSGTGKTSLPKIFCEAIYGDCAIVEVESSWRDKNELLGYYNEFSCTYTPKKFTQALYKAALDPDRVTFIVLDELNLSRIEYYFSDFLSLMENEEDKRQIKLVNVHLYKNDPSSSEYLALEEGHTLKIPSNVWFVGTANRDESTFEISDKVYDRAHTMNFNKRAPRILAEGGVLEQKYLSYDALWALLEDAKRTVSFNLESCAVVHEVEELLAPYNVTFGNRISNQMESFVKIYAACFTPTDTVIHEAVETILLSKVVSKLEFKNVDNKDELAAEFEKLNLHKCSAFIKALNED
ncbi:MAG: hypothetical protein IJZ33_01170 [Clostridia bacterium]|nr:hypothetical protein [Clostridia bacterium]